MLSHFYKQVNIILTKQQRRYMILLFVAMLIGAFLEALGVSIVVPLVTIITSEDPGARFPALGALFARLGLQSNREAALGCIALLVAVFIIKALYLLFEYRLQADFLSVCKFSVQDRLVDTLLRQPYSYFLDRNSSELHRIMINDLNTVFSVLHQVLVMLTELAVSAMLLLTLFWIEPVMSTWVLVIISGVVLLILKVIRPMLHRAGKEVMKQDRMRTRWISQGFAGIKVVKHMHVEQFIEDRIHETGLHIRDGERLRVMLNNIPKVVIETTCVCGMLGVMAGMAGSGKDLSSLLPAVSAFAMAAIKLMPSANKVTTSISTIVYNMPSLDNIAEVLEGRAPEAGTTAADTETAPAAGTASTAKSAAAAPAPDADIIFRHVTYTYPHTDRVILRDISLEIDRGQMVGIMGVSGAGKTTLADLMLGLLQPDSGSVEVSGSIGYIPQSTFLLDDSVRANVSFGVDPAEVSDETVWECLEEAQLAEYFRSVPEGLDTRVGERGVRLSGGQAQRIGIARALYRQPRILVFDEATSALDLDTEAAIIESVNHMHGRRTIVIIAHKSGVLADCDIIYKVVDGGLVPIRTKEETAMQEGTDP